MKPDIEEREIKNKELRFPLTHEDVERKAREAAAISSDLTAHRIESKKIRTELSGKEAGLENGLARTLNIISEGHEVRSVDCIERRNFDENKVEYLFEGKVIEDRPMTGSERQREMFDEVSSAPDHRKAAAGDFDDDDEPVDLSIPTHILRKKPEAPEAVECAKENEVTDGL